LTSIWANAWEGGCSSCLVVEGAPRAERGRAAPARGPPEFPQYSVGRCCSLAGPKSTAPANLRANLSGVRIWCAAQVAFFQALSVAFVENKRPTCAGLSWRVLKTHTSSKNSPAPANHADPFLSASQARAGISPAQWMLGGVTPIGRRTIAVLDVRPIGLLKHSRQRSRFESLR
jgi:hypothetical protein